MTVLLMLFSLIGFPAGEHGNGLIREAPVPADTLQRPQQLYAKATGLSQYLFNGPRYHVYDRNEETHQFYKTRDLLSGTLRYDGRDYGPYQMHYDINEGFLVIRQPLNGYLIRLDSAKVENFTLDGDYFEAIWNTPQLKKGIYQTLYDGETRLLCHRKKVRLEKIADMKLFAVFLDVDSYFVYVNGEYRKIQRKKDLYRLFPDHKAGIRSYFRRFHSSFKQEKEKHLLEIVRIIDQPKSAA